MTGSGTLDRIHHVAVPCDDLEEALSWYTSRFRCRVAYRDATWALLRFENASLALVTRGEHPAHFGIEGPAPEGFGAVRVHRDGVSYVYLTDPGGNVVEVCEGPSREGG
jgi:catechol 2,3-dioxygenase-like lactoylglutathione lyase family enzyme